MAHVVDLARLCSSSVVLIHVADGWAARNQQGLELRESAEMRDDLEYIESRRDELEAAGVRAECVLAGTKVPVLMLRGAPRARPA
jgi:hypothetical protein